MSLVLLLDDRSCLKSIVSAIRVNALDVGFRPLADVLNDRRRVDGAFVAQIPSSL